jgi:orotidine-5'-phosphate decarboxylase
MTRSELVANIFDKGSFLCIGLDTDPNRIPRHLLKYEDPVFEFNRQIIEATHDLCVAYKPNLAFYEANGAEGWISLERTLDIIPENIFTIADAKRGDIGNTSACYAEAFFQRLNFDALTVAPYMGEDSVTPFLGLEGKWVILLALTSNKGSADFQMLRLNDGRPVYEAVMTAAQQWASTGQLMFVVGATHPEKLDDIRRIAPDHFLLVPGVGAQGGSLEAVCKYGLNREVGLLVNSSRGIIYASDGEDFAQRAREKALELRNQMREILDRTFG